LSGVTAVLEDLVAGRPPRVPPAPGVGSLRAAARVHGLSGLAGKAILEDALAVPPGVADGILADWRRDQVKSALLDLELARIAVAHRGWAGHLASQPIVLKGPAVASRYRDPSLRGYIDLDLLVPSEDLEEWGLLLHSCGFQGPTRWQIQDAFYAGTALPYRRLVGKGALTVELHYHMSTGSRVRTLDYEALRPVAVEARATQGVLQATPEAQVLIMAVHLAHHPVDGRRLIWLRDFIELGLGGSEVIAGARALADARGQRRALEQALFAVEQVLGWPAWDARPGRPGRFGVEWVREVPQPGLLEKVALMRELGPAGAARFLLSRFDPRRFQTASSRFDPSELRAWVGRFARMATTTPWSKVVRGWGRK
jgi:hypothetical protein